ncbi:MAG: hypothetical protein J7L07_01425 [Candidatus Odinarchaeota archaeon]|nr:hypothetical protein [Candidatus Odinarchaeota archaeon]
MQKGGIRKLLSPYFFPILISIGGIILGIPLYLVASPYIKVTSVHKNNIEAYSDIDLSDLRHLTVRFVSRYNSFIYAVISLSGSYTIEGFILAKHNLQGNVIWAKLFGTENGDFFWYNSTKPLQFIVNKSSGDVFLILRATRVNEYIRHIFLVKINENSDLLWAKEIDIWNPYKTPIAHQYCLAIDENGNVLVTIRKSEGAKWYFLKFSSRNGTLLLNKTYNLVSDLKYIDFVGIRVIGDTTFILGYRYGNNITVLYKLDKYGNITFENQCAFPNDWEGLTPIVNVTWDPKKQQVTLYNSHLQVAALSLNGSLMWMKNIINEKVFTRDVYLSSDGSGIAISMTKGIHYNHPYNVFEVILFENFTTVAVIERLFSQDEEMLFGVKVAYFNQSSKDFIIIEYTRYSLFFEFSKVVMSQNLFLLVYNSQLILIGLLTLLFAQKIIVRGLSIHKNGLSNKIYVLSYLGHYTIGFVIGIFGILTFGIFLIYMIYSTFLELVILFGQYLIIATTIFVLPPLAICLFLIARRHWSLHNMLLLIILICIPLMLSIFLIFDPKILFTTYTYYDVIANVFVIGTIFGMLCGFFYYTLFQYAIRNTNYSIALPCFKKSSNRNLLLEMVFPILLIIDAFAVLSMMSNILLYDIVTIVSFTVSTCVFAFGITLWLEFLAIFPYLKQQTLSITK